MAYVVAMQIPHSVEELPHKVANHILIVAQVAGLDLLEEFAILHKLCH